MLDTRLNDFRYDISLSHRSDAFTEAASYRPYAQRPTRAKSDFGFSGVVQQNAIAFGVWFRQRQVRTGPLYIIKPLWTVTDA